MFHFHFGRPDIESQAKIVFAVARRHGNSHGLDPNNKFSISPDVAIPTAQPRHSAVTRFGPAEKSFMVIICPW